MNLRALKSRLVRLAAACGGYALARVLTARQPKILMYHRFSEQPEPGHVDRLSWRQQLAYLKRHHQVMNMAQFIALRARNAVPPHTVVLTIDDGYRDFYSVAFPELQRAGLSATLFVSTAFIDEQLWLWPDRLATIIDQLPEGELALAVVGEPRRYRLPAERARLAADLKVQLVPLPLAQKYQLLSALAAPFGIVVEGPAPEAFAPCSWAQLRDLQAAGIEIGGHSVHHPILSAEMDEQVQREIVDCKLKLDAELPQPVISFCYPNGEAADYDQRAKAACRFAGFTSAVAAHHDHLGFYDDYDLPRYSGSHDMFHVAKVASGIDYLGRRLAGTCRVARA